MTLIVDWVIGQEVLNDATIQFLMSRSFREDAKRHVCILPLGSIYWDDEMPDIAELMTLTEDERNQVLRLFGLRLKVWDKSPLSDEEQNIWESARQQAPDWALFARLELSADDQRARKETEAAVEKELEAFFADADQVVVTEKDGVQEFSATFDLRKTPSGSSTDQGVEAPA